MTVDRILKNTGGTIMLPLTVDGAATDPSPDECTVTVTNAAGTTVVPETPATDTGTGTFSFNLTSAHTALLDTLTATWVYTRDGNEESLSTVHEVVGGFLFTVAEFRALGSAYANTSNYPTSAVVDMRTTVEQALEDACDVAFVPRYYRETFSGQGSTTTLLRWPKVTAVRTVTIDGNAVTPVSSVVAVREGLAYYSSGWSAGYGNVTIGYEHGFPTPPMRMKRAGLLLAKRWLTPSAADDRAINMTNETGTYAIMQAGVRGHLFDLPEVVAAVDQYSLRVGVA